MGKNIPEQAPNETNKDYLKRLDNFEKNYWDFLVPNFVKDICKKKK